MSDEVAVRPARCVRGRKGGRVKGRADWTACKRQAAVGAVDAQGDDER